MRDIGQSNDNIFEKYQNVTLNESKKGYRRKVQLIDDTIDNLIDDIEKKIAKEDENPVYQRRLYQMLADMNKEHGEFLMSIKRIAGTIDSGAKTIPQAKGTMNPNNMQGSDEEPSPEAGAQATGTVPPEQGASPPVNEVEKTLPAGSILIARKLEKEMPNDEAFYTEFFRLKDGKIKKVPRVLLNWFFDKNSKALEFDNRKKK